MKLVFDFKPMPWKRARLTRNRGFFIDKDEAVYRKNIVAATRAQYQGTALLGPLSVKLVCYFEKPKSSKFDYPARIDCDNLHKVFGDALNGVLWADDSQIVRLEIHKRYGDKARTELFCYEMAKPLSPDSGHHSGLEN